MNGVKALSTVSEEGGKLADHSANYTSPQTQQDHVHALASVCRQDLAAKWAASPTLGLSCDEVRGADGESYLLSFLHSIDDEGMVSSDFFCCNRMTLDKESLRRFAQDEVKSPVSDSYPLTLKCGLNMAFMLDAHATRYFPGSIRWANVTACSLDGAGYAYSLSYCFLMST